MLNSETQKYQRFKLLNREISVTVDASTLPCGTNGAFYFLEMASSVENYGGGYCDATCPQYLRFVKDHANMPWHGWYGSSGACCPDFDVIETNQYMALSTLHGCRVVGEFECLD